MGARLSKPKGSGTRSMRRTRSVKQRGGALSATTTHRRGTPKTHRTTGRGGLHDLLSAYQGLSGFHASTLGLQDFKTTYGEVTDSGIRALSEKFRALAPSPAAPKKFIDLGCGIGRVVAGMAILNPDLQAYGVEIVPERVRFAQAAIQRLPSRQVAARIHVDVGDILKVPLKDYSWVFISNLCFDDATQRGLAERLAELPSGAIIICSKELPLGQGASPLTKIDGGFTIPMTWSQNSQCHAYRRA